MPIRLEVDTFEKDLQSDLFTPGTGDRLASAHLECLHSTENKTLGVPDTVTLVLSVPSAIVNPGIIAAWLYGKFHGRVTRLTIDGTEVEIEEGEIRRVLQEKITMLIEE
jgi:hypothetical protein